MLSTGTPRSPLLTSTEQGQAQDRSLISTEGGQAKDRPANICLLWAGPGEQCRHPPSFSRPRSPLLLPSELRQAQVTLGTSAEHQKAQNRPSDLRQAWESKGQAHRPPSSMGRPRTGLPIPARWAGLVKPNDLQQHGAKVSIANLSLSVGRPRLAPVTSTEHRQTQVRPTNTC